jgi:sterol 14-demethylase
VLFTAGPEVYYNQRPVLMAIFRRERMVGYITAMNAEVDAWLARLGQRGEMNITAEMQRLTQYVAAHAFLGAGHREELDEDFWQAYEAIGKSLDMVLPPNLPLPKFIKRDKARAYLRETFSELVAKRRADPAAYDDIITLMLNTPQKDGTLMTDAEMATMFTGLLFAGHETTAGQAAWTIIQLLQHPDYLATVQAEIAEHVQGRAVDHRTLRHLERISWAVDETTRLRPSADVQMRLVEEPIEIGGYTIPEGWRLVVSAAISHFDEEVFTEPQRYDPERHSPERNEASDPFSIVGFGGGIHKCTGMNFAQTEMTIIAARLLDTYRLTLETRDPHIVRDVGANRPSEAIISYARREQPVTVG